MNCCFCEKPLTAKGKTQHEKYCSLNPNRIIRVSPFKGKTHNSDTKAICATAAKKQHADGLGYIPSWTGKTHKSETRNKISDSMKGNRNANHRGDRQSFYKGIRMDSQWEVKVAQYLDSLNLDWQYSSVRYKLSDGRFYHPDFFLYENQVIVKVIEVKGYFREQNRLKYEKFLSEYPNVPIELWDKEVLKSKNIL